MNFELWPVFHSIYLIPILNLRPGLNSVALFTYIVKISSFQTGLPSWPTLITYKVGETGLDVGPHDGPIGPAP